MANVIIECTSCHARYQFDEDRFDRKPSKKIKCAKCGTIFEAQNPAFARQSPRTVDVGERTHIRSEKAAAPVDEEPPEAERRPIPGAPQMPVGKRLSLAVIDGADAGNVFRIEKPRITIGRSGADVNLNDTESSRDHAAVEIRDTTYLLEDLQSKNGTLVNGEKISGRVELQNQSEFQIGSTTLMLIVTEDV